MWLQIPSIVALARKGTSAASCHGDARNVFRSVLFFWDFQDVESEGPEASDWDKYALEEYEILVAEETANEQLQEG